MGPGSVTSTGQSGQGKEGGKQVLRKTRLLEATGTDWRIRGPPRSLPPSTCGCCYTPAGHNQATPGAPRPERREALGPSGAMWAPPALANAMGPHGRKRRHPGPRTPTQPRPVPAPLRLCEAAAGTLCIRCRVASSALSRKPYQGRQVLTKGSVREQAPAGS